ncbi:MAG: hypothetical protein QXK89_09570 [Candidatus Bathyarchaeia archaeon]
MLSAEKEVIQCPCGRIINSPEEYKVLYLKHELREIDILCPNDSCYLRELGYIKFDVKDGKAVFREASFYPPFVTWNSGRLGFERAEKILKDHLRAVAKKVDWVRLSVPSSSQPG